MRTHSAAQRKTGLLAGGVQQGTQVTRGKRVASPHGVYRGDRPRGLPEDGAAGYREGARGTAPDHHGARAFASKAPG
jgi:hypothetical protein